MPRTLARLVLCLSLLCSACGAPQLSVSAGGPSWPGYRSERDVGLGLPGYRRSRLFGPDIACDRYGRCWEVDRFHRYARAHPESWPPGWAENLPDSAPRRDRFLRPSLEVVCDRATRICYKQGRVDQSDTDRVFGESAGDRVDRVRNRLGTGRLFVPERGVACNRASRVCLEDGDPDRRLTRRYFGRRAARSLEEERPRGRDDRSSKGGSRRKER
jgi:hypothetical protein